MTMSKSKAALEYVVHSCRALLSQHRAELRRGRTRFDELTARRSGVTPVTGSPAMSRWRCPRRTDLKSRREQGMATERVLEVAVPRHVFMTEKPFPAVMDVIDSH